jgi:hypothetical protein
MPVDPQSESGPRSTVREEEATEGMPAGESTSQSLSVENHAKDDPEHIATSGNIHPKFVKALSQVPYSPLFGVLWPNIIEQASFETRDLFRKVNTHFQKLCHPYRRSDRAKRVSLFPDFTVHDVHSLCFISFQRITPGTTEIVRQEKASRLSLI